MKKYIYIGITTCTIEDGEREVLLYNGAVIELSDEKAEGLKARKLIEDAPVDKTPTKVNPEKQ